MQEANARMFSAENPVNGYCQVLTATSVSAFSPHPAKTETREKWDNGTSR